MGVDELVVEVEKVNGLRDELQRKALTEYEALEARKLELIAILGKKPSQPRVPKYRHPTDPTLTWTGKGKKPQWIADWIQDGKNPDDLLIPV